MTDDGMDTGGCGVDLSDPDADGIFGHARHAPSGVRVVVVNDARMADAHWQCFVQGWLEGSLPFAHSLGVRHSGPVVDVLPEGFEVDRVYTASDGVAVSAHGRGHQLHVKANGVWRFVTCLSTSDEAGERLLAEIRARVHSEVPADDVELVVRTCSSMRHQLIAAPPWAEVQHNYPAGVRRALGRLMGSGRPTGSARLVLWHGEPGTGKTSAIRSLVREWEDWCQAQYIADPEQLFGDPDYLENVLTARRERNAQPSLTEATADRGPWRLVIAEDSDEFLRSSARREAGAALGRLLNVTDGLLGDRMNALVLLTTNEPVARLHPALIRPGRCLAEVEFEPFSPAEAAEWLGAAAPAPTRALTLAELLERRGDLVTNTMSSRAPLSTGTYL
jgi:hypothetical protein